MKILPVLAVASVALNAALAYGLWVSRAPQSRATAVSGPPTHTAETEAKHAFARASAEWKTIADAHPRELRELLDRSDIPPRERYRMERTLLAEYGEKRRAQLLGVEPMGSRPYWKDAFTPPRDAATTREIAALDTENFRLQRDLNLRSFNHDPTVQNLARLQFGDLPIEKLQRLFEARSKLELARADLLAEWQLRPEQPLTPQQRAQLGMMEQASTDQVRSIMSADEYAQYELNYGQTTQQLRYILAGFQPTEQEFKALHTLYSGLALNTPPEKVAQIREQIKALLGDERYADYEEAHAHGPDQLNILMARLNLPLRTATMLRSVRADVTARAKEIRNDAHLTEAERAASLSTLADETRRSLTTALGDEGFAAYNELKGEWLRTLNR